LAGPAWGGGPAAPLGEPAIAMFKRLRWLGLGALAGVGGSIWAQRRVRQAVDRVMPAQLGHELRRRVGRVSADVRASLGEGRTAMAEREAELRARLPDGVTALPGIRQSGRGRVIDVEDRGRPGSDRGRSDRRDSDRRHSERDDGERDDAERDDAERDDSDRDDSYGDGLDDGPRRSDGHHPSSAPSAAPDRATGPESTVTELSAARRSRPERRRRRR
jgi:hypothetical protein